MRRLQVGLLVLASGCPVSGPACPDGQLLDQEEACVPEVCGATPWADPGDAAGPLLRVAPLGDDGWDGSERWPFATVQAAADEAGAAGGGLVLVAAGTYRENLALGDGHDGVRLLGRCPELVTIEGEEEAPAVEILGGRIELGALTLTGRDKGLVVSRTEDGEPARVTVAGLVVRGATGHGIQVGQEASLELDDCQVHDTLSGSWGRGNGLHAGTGSEVTGRGLRVQGIRGRGVAAANYATVDLAEVEILDTLPPDIGAAVGVEAWLDGSITLRGLRVAGTAGYGGLALQRGRLVLEDASIEDTEPPPYDQSGAGLAVAHAGRLEARDVRVVRSRGAGLYMGGQETAAELRGVEIRDGRVEPDGTGGRGVVVADGAALVAWDLLVADSSDLGVGISGSGSTAALHESEVRGTRRRADGAPGEGLQVTEGAAVLGEGLSVVDNDGVALWVRDPGSSVVLGSLSVRQAGVGTGGMGVVLQDGATLEVSGLELQGSAGIGLLAEGADTTALLAGGVVRDTRRDSTRNPGVGLAVQSGGRVEAVGLQLLGNDGPGIYAVDEGHFEGTDCLLADNGFAGAIAAAAGLLTLRGGEVRSSGSSPGRPGGTGLFAWDLQGAPSLSLDGVTFSELRYPGLYLRGDGRYEVRDCVFEDSGSDLPPTPGGVLAMEGVQAWRPVDRTSHTGLLLSGNTFATMPGDAVLLDGSTALLEGNDFEQVDGLPVYWQSCADLSWPEGPVEAPPCQVVPHQLEPALEFLLDPWEAQPVE